MLKNNCILCCFNKILKVNYFLFFYSIILLVSNINAQHKKTEQNSFSVEWIGKFSSAEDFENGNGFFSKIIEFFAGEEKTGLTRPIALFVEEDKYYMILDQGAQTPFLIDVNESEIKQIKAADFATFPSLVGICKTGDDNILFTDSKLGKIFKMNKSLDKVEVFNKSFDLAQPTGIAYSEKTDQIWVIETAEHRLAILDKNGNLLQTIGKRGSEPGEFNYPTFLWIDAAGFVYVNDSMNYRIQIFSSSGNFIKTFGEVGDATGYFARPKGVATDSYGQVYVVDALFNTVQIFNQKGEFLCNFGYQGRGDGEFWLPTGIFITNDDKMYIADSYNKRIQIFKLKPVIK